MAEKNRKDNPQEQEQDLSQILQVRRDKLAALQKEGKDPFQQTKFTVSAHTQQIKDHFDQMEGQAVTVAGRLMSKRGMGKEMCIRDSLQEVFKKNPIDALDQETLFTINKFFENNLNVSETARKLFVHRNTLVYRLEKIKKLTGLDLREFDDAITFKVALMVKKYLVSRGIES